MTNRDQSLRHISAVRGMKITVSKVVEPVSSAQQATFTSQAQGCATPSLRQNEHATKPVGLAALSEPERRRVLIAIDDSFHSQGVITHGLAIAEALNAGVDLLRALENQPRPAEVGDPVQWHLLREQASNHIDKLAERHPSEGGPTDAQIEEGRLCDQICRWMHKHQAGLIALSSRGIDGENYTALGRTACRVLESAPSLVLLVPASASPMPPVRYKKVLVPLDGSSCAETALPQALRIAEGLNAEVILVHAVPEPELTETGPLESEGLELQERLLRRNERVARAYLEQIQSHLTVKNVRAQMTLLSNGDPRHLLAAAISDQHADLVVMASHGHGGHLDLPTGSVASYVLEQANIPVLLVRESDSPEVGGAPNIRSAFPRSPWWPQRTELSQVANEQRHDQKVAEEIARTLMLYEKKG
jgi:nucleotide-binding universal stress UspA family protein